MIKIINELLWLVFFILRFLNWHILLMKICWWITKLNNPLTFSSTLNIFDILQDSSASSIWWLNLCVIQTQSLQSLLDIRIVWIIHCFKRTNGFLDNFNYFALTNSFDWIPREILQTRDPRILMDCKVMHHWCCFSMDLNACLLIISTVKEFAVSSKQSIN